MLPTKKTWEKLRPLFPLRPLPPTMRFSRSHVGQKFVHYEVCFQFFPYGRHGLSKRIRMVGFLERPWCCIVWEITHENVVSNELIRVKMPLMKGYKDGISSVRPSLEERPNAQNVALVTVLRWYFDHIFTLLKSDFQLTTSGMGATLVKLISPSKGAVLQGYENVWQNLSFNPSVFSQTTF